MLPAEVQGIRPTAAKTLLGQEGLHGVFDATDGLNSEALAVLAGSLQAGSWLVLLVPEWRCWPSLPDTDSLRWSEQGAPITTPNFIHHLQRQLLADPDVVLWLEGQPPPAPIVDSRPEWQRPDGSPTLEQQNILQRLMQAKGDLGTDRGSWARQVDPGRHVGGTVARPVLGHGRAKLPRKY